MFVHCLSPSSSQPADTEVININSLKDRNVDLVADIEGAKDVALQNLVGDNVVAERWAPTCDQTGQGGTVISAK
jgi:hypothetical protein